MKKTYENLACNRGGRAMRLQEGSERNCRHRRGQDCTARVVSRRNGVNGASEGWAKKGRTRQRGTGRGVGSDQNATFIF